MFLAACLGIPIIHGKPIVDYGQKEPACRKTKVAILYVPQAIFVIFFFFFLTGILTEYRGAGVAGITTAVGSRCLSAT